MPSVEEIWDNALPPGSQLLGGKAGLWRRVTGASRMRPLPPGLDRLMPGDFVLVSVQTMLLLDDTLALETVLAQAAATGAVGMGVVGEITPEQALAADELNLPLIALPGGSNVAELEQSLVRYLLRRGAEDDEQTAAATRELNAMALHGAGLAAILKRLAELSQANVQLLDDQLQTLHHYGSSTDQQQTIHEMTLHGDITLRLSYPADRDSQYKQTPRLLQAGASALTIELVRLRAAAEARRHLEGNLLDELAAAPARQQRMLTERALRLGIDLTRAHAAAVVTRLDTPGSDDPAALAEEVEAATRQLAWRTLFRHRGERSALLIPLEPGDESSGRACANSLFAELQTQGAACCPAGYMIGVGSPAHDIAELQNSLNEAEQALEIGLRLASKRAVLLYREMGLDRLLLEMRNSPLLNELQEQLLGALIAYDKRHRSGLIPTLAAFYQSGQQLVPTAQLLNVHRNTLIYRLRRIQQISGRDPADSETALAFQIALRAYMLAAD